MLKHVLQLLALTALAVSAPLTLAQRTPILVYTAIETDQLKSYKDAFEAAVKDVEIRWVRDSTGVVTAKLLAEKNNPQADVVLGLAATSLLVLEQEGMLTPYAPKGVEKLNPRFVDTKKPPMWVGMDVWGATICFNTVEAKKRNLPKPETWKDLLKPIYKGQITMPQPGLERHRLPRRHRLAADVRRGRRLEVHGRAAPEHRAVRALGLASRAARPAPASS